MKRRSGSWWLTPRQVRGKQARPNFGFWLDLERPILSVQVGLRRVRCEVFALRVRVGYSRMWATSFISFIIIWRNFVWISSFRGQFCASSATLATSGNDTDGESVTWSRWWPSHVQVISHHVLEGDGDLVVNGDNGWLHPRGLSPPVTGNTISFSPFFYMYLRPHQPPVPLMPLNDSKVNPNRPLPLNPIEQRPFLPLFNRALHNHQIHPLQIGR